MEVLLILVAMLRLGNSSKPKTPMDDDSAGRISTCIKIITEANSPRAASEHSKFVQEIFIQNCHISFAEMLKEKLSDDEKEKKQIKVESSVHPDDLIRMGQLRAKKNYGIFFYLFVLFFFGIFLTPKNY